MPDPTPKKPTTGATESSGGGWLGTIALLFIGGMVGAIGARFVTKMLDGDPPQQQALPPAGGYPPPGYYYPPAMPPWYPR